MVPDDGVRLLSPGGAGLLAQVGQGGARRDRLGVEDQVQERRSAGGQRLGEGRARTPRWSRRGRRRRRRRGPEPRSPGCASAVPETRPGCSRSWCMRMVPYMPLSTTITTIGELVLDGGRQLLAGHQEAAVAGEADDRALGMRAAWRRPPPAGRSPSSPRSAPAGCRGRDRRSGGWPRWRSCRRRW